MTIAAAVKRRESQRARRPVCTAGGPKTSTGTTALRRCLRAEHRGRPSKRRRVAAAPRFLRLPSAGKKFAGELVPHKVEQEAIRQPAKKERWAVILGRGDRKGDVISRHRSRDAAIKAAQAGGANWSIVQLSGRTGVAP